MTVQDASTVTIPSQAGPADPPLASAPLPALPPATAGLPGSERPLTADERQFRNGLIAMFAALTAYIVTFLLLAMNVWG